MNDEDFARLVKQYEIELYRIAYVVVRNDADAQDAVCDAIVKAYEKKGRLRDCTKFKSWLIKIVINSARNLLRKESHLVYMDDVTEEVEEQQSVESDNTNEKELWNLVLQLENEFRVVVVLYYYENFSTKQISQMLRIPEGTVKSRLSRARERLKNLLG